MGGELAEASGWAPGGDTPVVGLATARILALRIERTRWCMRSKMRCAGRDRACRRR